MILTKQKILEEYSKGLIHLEPFSQWQLNPNSYNYRIGNILKVYSEAQGKPAMFDSIIMKGEGYILEEGQIYLASTFETIGSSKYAMSLIGKSSLGRLGLFLQCSSNLGHTGSCHKWTLELVAAKKIKIYPYMTIGQVSFWENSGTIRPYNGVYQQYNLPTESFLHEQR